MTDPTAFVRVSPRDPRYLELSDGRPYIPIGLNMVSPYLTGRGPTADGAEEFALMERWMRALAANGGNTIRVWLALGIWNVERRRAGVYDEEPARRLDAMLGLACALGIRVKMTFEYFREIDPALSKTTWAICPLHHRSRGGTAGSIAEWFDGEESRAQFRSKMAWYAARYGAEPAVYGWELWNEIECVQGGDFMAWTQAMLSELHRLFPRNLCMQSLGSFDAPSKRDPYRRLSTMPGNDLAQVHRYLDLGAALEVCHGPVDVLAADAVREVLAFSPGRPVILAESGAVEPTHAGPFKLYAADRDGVILHDVLFAPFFAGAAGGGQCWHWSDYVDPNDLWWQFGRFAQAVQDLDPPAEGFRPSMIAHERLRVYALTGRRTVLAWCRDKENTWTSELRDGVPPETLEGLEVDLPMPPAARVRTYDPWTDEWAEATPRGGRIVLPAFRRSIVVRLDTEG